MRGQDGSSGGKQGVVAHEGEEKGRSDGDLGLTKVSWEGDGGARADQYTLGILL